MNSNSLNSYFAQLRFKYGMKNPFEKLKLEPISIVKTSTFQENFNPLNAPRYRPRVAVRFNIEDKVVYDSSSRQLDGSHLNHDRDNCSDQSFYPKSYKTIQGLRSEDYLQSPKPQKSRKRAFSDCGFDTSSDMDHNLKHRKLSNTE